jgi:hypothetical protein
MRLLRLTMTIAQGMMRLLRLTMTIAQGMMRLLRLTMTIAQGMMRLLRITMTTAQGLMRLLHLLRRFAMTAFPVGVRIKWLEASPPAILSRPSQGSLVIARESEARGDRSNLVYYPDTTAKKSNG